MEDFIDSEPYEAQPTTVRKIVCAIAAWIGGVIVMVALAFLAMAAWGLFIWATEARAHEAAATVAMPQGWSFDGWCCNGNAVEGDCDRIPQSAVKPVDGGFQVTLRPGDHRLVTTQQSYPVFAQKEVRDAPDGYYYACLYPTQDKLRCLYAPPMGY